MKKITLAFIVILSLFITACNVEFDEQPNDNEIYFGELDLSSDELLKFENIEELEEYLNKVSDETENTRSAGSLTALSSKSVMDSDMVLESVSAPMAAEGGIAGASDYSSTNVQVQGVDEADFVKNDDKYIYMISGNSLLIIDAMKGEDAKVISEISLGGDNYRDPTPVELFINDNKLAVFVQLYEESYRFSKYDIRPMRTYRQNTEVYLYDISDRENPEKVDTIKSSGRYYQSRMIDGKIYLITLESTGYGYLNPPMILRGDTRISPEIYYFPNLEESYQFNTITSIDIKENEVVDSKTFMLGYSNTLMMSEDNIYIAYQKNNYWRWNSEPDRDRFFDVVVPLLESELKKDVDSVIAQGLNEDKEWEKIEIVLADFFTEIEKSKTMQDDYEDMLTEISEAIDDYDLKKQLENRKTIIHKLSVDNGEIDYVAKGEVDGQLLNQFSMDESNGNLRVATTVSVWMRERIQYNNVYVLDEDMKEIGLLEEIAEDERIYSTRFLGDKLFMVTFRQTDPFFVIDLSNPEKPEIFGELKLPGFSNYLHPISENLILGVGKETTETKWGFTTNGVKIALFDVSDYANPKLVDKREYGGSGSTSEILNDHKAFLYAPTKDNMIVIPVKEVEEKNDYYGTRRVWSGAYILSVDETGFEDIGEVEHSSVSTRYYWQDSANVKRSIYMDDYLFTVSNTYFKINDLNNLKELNSIKLSDDESIYPDYRYADEEIMVEPRMI